MMTLVSEKQMTIAEQLRDELGGDGAKFTAPDGRSLAEVVNPWVCREEFGESFFNEETSQNEVRPAPAHQYTNRTITRCVFSDGSALVVTEGCWDVEGAEPFSMLTCEE